MAIQKRFSAVHGLDANNLTIVNVVDPVNPQDVATRNFSSNADNLASGTLDVARLDNSGVVAGTYNDSTTAITPVTVDTKGRVTATGAAVTITPAWSSITSKPTTVSGYGLTDVYTKTEVDSAITSSTPTWASLTGKPTTIAGFGITDAYTQTEVNNFLAAKANLSGATFTGNVVIPTTHYITLTDAPVNGTDAVNKGYVDGLLSGLVWKNPIEADNLLGIATVIPGSPSHKDVYVIGPALGGTGVWSAFADGDVVQYQDTAWVLIKSFEVGDRYGISMSVATSAIGALAGKDDQICTLGGTAGAVTFTNFELPVEHNAVFVKNPNAWDFGKNFTYTGTSWIEFGGPTAFVYGTGLSLTGRTINVNLGAGISELPSDEVGIDTYASGGLMTTLDGINANTTTSAQLSLTPTGVTAGTYQSVTVNAHGRITAGTNPTTLAGYGITDAQASNNELTAFAALADTPGFVVKTGDGAYTLDSNTYITGNQTITLTGDVTGSGTTSFATTLANSGVAAGTYNNSATAITPFTVDGKGRITATGAAVTITPDFTSIANKPTTLSGYGITDAISTNGTLPLTHGQIASNSVVTTSVTAGQVLDSVAIATFRSVEYLVQAVQGTDVQVTKVIATHDGTTPYATEYGNVVSDANLGTFDVTISAGNMSLVVTPASASSTTFKVIRVTTNL